MNQLIETILRFFRFGIIGIVATLTYGIFAFFLTQIAGIGQVYSSLIAYIFAMPISFWGQKRFTFRSKASYRIEMPRFLLVQGVTLMLTAVVTAVFAHIIGAPPIFAIVAVMIVIPLCSYFAMSVLVFRAEI